MSDPKPKPKHYFAAVDRARKAMDKAVVHAAKKLTDVMDKQAAAGESTTAQWVLEHYEKEGQRPLATSIDKQKEVSGDSGVKVLIGLPFTGQLPSIEAHAQKVLDVKPIEPESDK